MLYERYYYKVKAETWNRVPGFNPYQSFYIDSLPNGNMVLSPVAFPSLALNLPEGGRSTAYQHYTLWSKEDIGNGLNRQFKVDVLGYGADTAMPKVATVNTPFTQTLFKSDSGTVNLVNNNPIGVVGSKINSGTDFENLIDEPLRKNPHFMTYYKALPKVQNVVTQGNFCPEIARGEYTSDMGVYYIRHMNSCGKVYTYLNKSAMIQFRKESLNYVTFAGGAVLVGGYVKSPYIVIPSGAAATIYGVLANDLESCLNQGGNSAWLVEYEPSFSVKYAFNRLTCSF